MNRLYRVLWLTTKDLRTFRHFILMYYYHRAAMGNLSSLLSQMGNASTAAILMGNVKGLMKRLTKERQTDINIGFSPDSDMNVCIFVRAVAQCTLTSSLTALSLSNIAEKTLFN